MAGVFAVVCFLAPRAGAVLVHVKPHQVAGVAPHVNVKPASLKGSFASSGATAAGPADTGVLQYHGGIVLHSSDPYLIFWDPSSSIAPASEALLERYFTDTAVEGGASTDVFGVGRQFTDTTGFADASETFSASSQAFVDTQPYPASCTQTKPTYPVCLTDAQLQTEIGRFILANSLPTGTGANAPVYFIVTPATVNICIQGTGCASSLNGFCSYHSSFTDSSHSVLYAAIPLFFDGASSTQNPKLCQSDGTSEVQEPNADIADVSIKYMSHEYNETITDPVDGGGWWDTRSGNEDGDNCNFYGPTSAPAQGENPDAFLPTLGGSPGEGTLFDQLINGHPYYTQTEWSNGNLDCESQPVNATLAPAFATSVQSGDTVTLDPSGSSSSGGYSSTTWSFGDNSGSFVQGGPVPVSHTFPGPGAYTVTLQLVDSYGNLTAVSHTVTVPMSAAFTPITSLTTAGTPVSFNASGSSDPSGSITSYSWSFGDGSSASGVDASHAYATAGTYTVILTTSDASGTTASTSGTVTVTVPGAPAAVISTSTVRPVAGVPVSLSAAASIDTGSSITSYNWSFGDGSAASGSSVSHTYTSPGDHTVTLTVSDASGQTATTTKTLSVTTAKITHVSVKKGKKVEKITATVNGPGKLRYGSKHATARGPGKLVLHVKLSPTQRSKLNAGKSVTIKVKLKFSPTFGTASRKTVTIKIKG